MVNLLEYLERAAVLSPDKTAFSDENESVSFARLNRLGKSVGTYLARHVGAVNRPVAVLTSHRAADVAAFIGTLYAGCFYIPLDATAPQAHISASIDTLKPDYILNASSIGELPVAEPDFDALVAVRRKVLATDPAYAVLTSGSTGTPKAALVSHGSVINLAEWLCEEFGFTQDTVFAGQAPFYFDASVKELYSTLKCRATTHLIAKKRFISPLRVLQIVDELGVNVMPWASAAVKMVANTGALEKHVPRGVTDVIFGGENMPARIINIWRKAMPETRFTNVYGPTEATVDSSFYTVSRELSDDESVPIGRCEKPVRNVGLLLLDGDMRPVHAGCPGELHVRGAGVGLGYYGNPARTATAFVQNPFTQYRDIIYKTGDIVRINEHNEIVFLARADDQVKHMGSRIELGEVEAAAAAVTGVSLVCCSYDKGELKILMFFEGTIGKNELMAELVARLPKYMLPNILIKVDEMPSTPNGKIDRQGVRSVYYDGKRQAVEV